ncbi:MAG TPA: hypothetical protein VG939_22165 [Caulobacteraceae bacterium]|nr:hypothetical protein [Caulobacteraceae bacterium]
MRWNHLLVVGLAAGLLASCATTYDKEGWTGGFSEQQLGPARWRVVFSANGYTSRETAQTYWLYRCAQLTLEKNYTAFRVVTPMPLISAPRRTAPASGLTRAQYDLPADHTKPWLGGEIELLRGRIEAAPPHVFDAAALKAALEPHVNGPKCGGNVCPHLHDYLFAKPPAPAMPAAPVSPT